MFVYGSENDTHFLLASDSNMKIKGSSTHFVCYDASLKESKVFVFFNKNHNKRGKKNLKEKE